MDKQAVARRFSQAAAGYDSAAHLQRRVADAMLDRVLDLPLPGEPVVADLGTGTGYCLPTLWLGCRPARLHALDLSAAMLARARVRCPQSHPCLADLEHLPFADHSHDLLTSSLAVQWLGTPRPFLAEVRRVLRPGGYLALTTLTPGTLHELRQAWRSADAAAHVNTFTHSQHWRRCAERTGLRLLDWRQERIEVRYTDPIQLLRELKCLGANHVEGRSGPVSRAALKRMLAGYERFRQDDGRYPASWRVLHLVLRQPERPVSTEGRVQRMESTP